MIRPWHLTIYLATLSKENLPEQDKLNEIKKAVNIIEESNNIIEQK